MCDANPLQRAHETGVLCIRFIARAMARGPGRVSRS
jgi:hypothetical protein